MSASYQSADRQNASIGYCKLHGDDLHSNVSCSSKPTLGLHSDWRIQVNGSVSFPIVGREACENSPRVCHVNGSGNSLGYPHTGAFPASHARVCLLLCYIVVDPSSSSPPTSAMGFKNNWCENESLRIALRACILVCVFVGFIIDNDSLRFVETMQNETK